MRVADVHRADQEKRRRRIGGCGHVAMALLACAGAGFQTDRAAAVDSPLQTFDLHSSTPWAESGSLDVLGLVPASNATPARIKAVGRLNGGDDPGDATLGMGGVDLSWRPDKRISIAMIAGGMMDRFDGGGSDPTGRKPRSAFRDPLARDPLGSLAGRTAAFDGLDFGGFSAAAVKPFDHGRAMRVSTKRDRLQSMFMATRAIMRPADGTSIGFIATHGGSLEEDRSLFGVDLGHEIGGHRVDLWFQQSLGSLEEDDVSTQDRMALGASLGGSIASLRYRLGWRQVGESFESGLGSSGSGGVNSLLGSLDWGAPISGLSFIERVEIGVAAIVDADADFDPNKVDIEIDAIRFVGSAGHRIELGMIQKMRPDLITGEGLSSQEQYRVAVVSDPSLPLKLQGQVDLGEHHSDSAARWNGSARWTPGGGFHLGGSVRAESRTDEIELRETLQTSIESGFSLGQDAAFRSSLGFDSARDRLSLGHSLGLTLQTNAALSIRLEQQLPVTTDSQEPVQIRASIGGKFEF